MNNTLLTENLALNTDSYKTSHWLQLPPGTTTMYSYGESRGSDQGYTKVVQWGMLAILKKFFLKPITTLDVKRAKRFVDRHIKPGVFNYDGWMYIVEQHGGKLPLHIRALREGSVIPLRNVMFSVEATDERCAWLGSYFEPLMLQLWYSSTVASIAFQIRETLEEFFDDTVDDDRREQIAFKLHDFGFRGAAAPQAAEIGGGGHLLSFLGSDNMRAIAGLYDFYNLDEEDDNSMPAFSVIASEHSTMCANSDADRRDDAGALEKMVQILEEHKSIVSAVADTYDVFRFVERVCSPTYQKRIRESGGTLVVRPDSGDPTVIPVTILEMLLDGYGYTMNSKGYKVLPDCIRVLQGDGINGNTIRVILEKLKDLKISAENIVFGMGGALLQHCDRDWFKFAMKGSSITINGKQSDLYKDPITDAVKRSKRGRVTTFLDQSNQYFSDRLELQNTNTKIVDQMITFYKDGVLNEEADESFTVIRERVQRHFM